jgi:sterol desaturase/sphingolipid hydroxylase (fatty acid hydroxylase superfamily)
MTSIAIAFLLSAAMLAAIFIPLERAFPARHQKMLRPELGLDAIFFIGQYALWNGLSLLLLASVESRAAGYLAPLQSAVGGAPLWLQAIAAVVLGDLSVYAFHRASHRFDFLWRFHSVHHSSEHLDWIAAHREHPVDGVLTQLSANLPVLLLGLRVEVLMMFITLRGIWAVFVHANVRVPLGPFRWVMGAPEWHRYHHARDVRSTKNFANLSPWIDWLFGTHHFPADESYALGIRGEREKSYVHHLVAPMVPATTLNRLHAWARRMRAILQKEPARLPQVRPPAAS